MDEEKKEEVSKETEDKSEVEEKDKSEEKSEEKDDFEKDSDVVSVGKYNQAVRKQREAELEKRELEKKLAEIEKKPSEKKEEKEDNFFEDDEDDIDNEVKVDPSKIIDEKLKPIQESLSKREANEKKIQRTAFFEKYPQYLDNSEKWQELLDEMDNSLNPSSNDDYFTQLEKAHRIIAGNSADDAIVEKKKAEIASDASSSGDGAQKAAIKEEFTAEDREHMKTWNISEDGMRAYKKKIAEGTMTVSG